MINKLDAAIRFFLCILILMLPFSKATIESCIYIMLVLWIAKRIFVFSLESESLPIKGVARNRKLTVFLRAFKPTTNILNGPIGLFIFTAILSVIGSLYFPDSLRAFFTKTLRGIILYFIIIEVIKKKKHIFIICGLILLSAVVVSFDGLIQYFFTGFDIFLHRQMDKGAISASFNHSNDLGAYLIFPLSLVIAVLKDKFYTAGSRYRAKNNKLQTAGLLFLLCLLAFAMILTKSRGAWLGMLVGIFLLIFVIYRRVFIWLGISTVLILTLSLLSAPQPTLRNFRLEPIFVQNTYFSRMAIWRNTVSMIRDRPFFGHGINTYMREFQKYRDLPWSSNPTYAHNCYLQMAAEMGLFGLMAFLWIIGRFFRKNIVFAARYSLQNMNGHKPEQIVDYAFLGILAGLSAFLVHSFLDTNLYSLQLNTLFWYMLGLVIACREIKSAANK